MKKLLLMWISLYPLFSFSQLSSYHNRLRAGDEIIKQQVEAKDPGRAGENVIWNFGALKSINNEYALSYHSPPLINDSIYILGRDTLLKEEVLSKDLLIGIEHSTMYYYRYIDNKLFCLGHENPRNLIHHNQPLLQIEFPYYYGKNLTTTFSTKGVYSSMTTFETQGDLSIACDARGKMVLPSGDTLTHVVRIKTVQDYFDNRENPLTEDSIFHMRNEKYQWYVKGYRYPVFETNRSLMIQEDEEKHIFSTSFFYPPLEQYYSLDEDPENQMLRDSIYYSNQHITRPSDKPDNEGIGSDSSLSYNYYPNPVKTTLNLEYSPEEETSITISLYDLTGRKMYFMEEPGVSPGIYKETIDVSAFTPGNYTLQIKTEKHTINEKIIKIN